MPIVGLKVTENVVYTYAGIVYSLKRKRNPVPCDYIDETRGHYANWNKTVTNEKMHQDSTYLKLSNS